MNDKDDDKKEFGSNLVKLLDTGTKSGRRVRSEAKKYLDKFDLSENLKGSILDEFEEVYLRHIDELKRVSKYEYKIPIEPFVGLSEEAIGEIPQAFNSCVVKLIQDFQLLFFELLSKMLDIIIEKHGGTVME
jgi:hypothetical protein